MKLIGINSTLSGYETKKEINKKSPASDFNITDRVTISASSFPEDPEARSQKELNKFFQKNRLNTPLYLDVNGTKKEKTIRTSISEDEITLNLKHTNDIHGNMPFVANLIEPDEFWVDAGDVWQSYNFHSVISQGREETDMMNLKDCDLAIPGNHFFDGQGLKGAENTVKSAEFPFLTSNANIKGTSPYTIAEVEGVKIAFIGVQTPDTKTPMIHPDTIKDLKITDPLKAVKKSVEELKKKGIDNIIVISHLGLERCAEHNPDHITDKELAELVPGIDLIIGGHTHTPTYDEVTVNGTRIVHAGINAHLAVNTADLYIGDLSLKIDRKTKKIKSIEDKLIKVDRSLPLDEEVEKIKNKYLETEKNALDEKVGKISQTLTFNASSRTDTTLGNMITDAIRKETGADIAVLSSKFFTPPMKKVEREIELSIPSGEVTMDDIVNSGAGMGKVQDVNVETWQISGEELKALLEKGVDRVLKSGHNMGLYQVSGLEMTYDPEREKGDRITEILVGTEPLKEDKNYRFSASYLTGHSEYLFTDRYPKEIETGREIRHIFADYIRSGNGKIPVKTGRIKLVSSEE